MWGELLKTSSSHDGFVGTGAGTASLPHSLWEPSCSLTLCRNPREVLEQEHNWALVPSWAHLFSLPCLLSLFQRCHRRSTPQLQTRNATTIIYISSWNHHLAIIFPLLCVFLGSTSATFQNRIQSQRFPTALKTSGACKPLWSGKTGFSSHTLQAAENNKHTFPWRSLFLHKIIAKFTKNYGWQFSRLFWF